VTRNATPPTPPTPPALAASEATTLLDRLIYEQVVACIDLDELYALEQALTLLTTELDGVGPGRAPDLARALIDAALRRLPDDLRRYLDAGGGPPFDGCPLCEEEAHASRSSPGSSQRRGSRLRS
jgi:uncharacterized protein YjeT (DUF2065 family)